LKNYPELKSNQNVTALMDELAGTETVVAVEKNNVTMTLFKAYNNKVKRFPGSIIANATWF